MTETSAGETPQSGGTAQPARTGKRSNWTIAHKAVEGVITFTVKGAGELQLDTAKVNEAVMRRAAVHGLVQRVSDAAAIARDQKTGASATPGEKLAAMARLVEHYMTGTAEWSPARGEGGEREPTGAADLRAALAELFPTKTAERLAEYVKGLKPAERAALAGSEKVKPIIDRLKDERAKVAGAGVDAEKLLEGLGD